MDVLQTWLIVGVPGLIITAALLVGHSTVRATLAYVVLALVVTAFIAGPSDQISAAVVGLIGFALVANGRGTHTDLTPEQHENRKRYTTNPSHS